MKNTTLLILLSLFITSCGDNIREEITERYDNGKMKTIMKFIGESSEELMIEKLVYSQSGDTLVWENYNSKGEKDGNWIGYISNRLVKTNTKIIKDIKTIKAICESSSSIFDSVLNRFLLKILIGFTNL